MSKNRNRTRRIYGIILTSCIIIWIGSVSLQMLSNRHNAWIASEMILQQLEDVIEENKESYQTLLETLKEEYTLRAETVANLLEMEGRLYQTTEEYRKIAKQLRVDEIHIINTGLDVSWQEQIRSILATAFLPANKWDILSPC